jgi:hypothetical protein
MVCFSRRRAGVLLVLAGALASCSSGGSSSSSEDGGGEDGSTDAGMDSTTPVDGAANEAGSADGGLDARTDADASPAEASTDATTDAAADVSTEGSADGGGSDASDGGTDGPAGEASAPTPDASPDAADASAADAPAESEAGTGGPSLWLFDGHSSGGALGGRTGVDDLCATAATGDAGPLYAHVHAFLSVNDTDEIRDMPSTYSVPTNLPIRSQAGTIVATDWTDLLDGTIDTNLAAAGVFTGTFWYSGSNADGSIATSTVDGGVHPLTCTGWTDGSGFLDASYGVSNSTTSTWMATGQATCGLSSYHVLCLGW